MPTPAEQAAGPEGAAAPEPTAPPEGTVLPKDERLPEDTGLPNDPVPPTDTAPEPEPAPAAVPGPSPTQPQPNWAATASLIAGILGVTAIGALLGLGFGAVALIRARRIHTGKVRAWTGIILSLLWIGAFAYVTPHIVKAADPGCTTFKEKALPLYNRAIEDLNTSRTRGQTRDDMASAVAGLASAAAKSKNTQARQALLTLTHQLTTASKDQITGRIPTSVMRTLNIDAVNADNACGTI
jgi:hypothetical protein